MNEQIFTPQFRAAFQSLVTYEVTDWKIIKEDIRKQTGETGQPYYEIPAHETKSGQPEIFQLAYEDAYDNDPAYYNLKF
jgi:hypothetical protein